MSISENVSAITEILTTHTMEVTTTFDPGTEDEDEPYPHSVVCVLLFLFAIIGLTNIVGNTLTIVAFFRDNKLQTVHNHYILNLAITDLIIGVSSVPFYAVYTILQFTWPFGYVFCKIWLLVDFLSCAESVATIILISIDRFLLVSLGIQYSQKQTKNMAKIKIAVSWFLSFLLYGPAIIGFNHWRGYSTVEHMDCDVEFATDYYYTVIASFIEFCVPLVLVCFFNLRVYLSIRHRSNSVVPMQMQGVQQGTLRRDKKAARSLAILVFVYFVCWTPYTITTIIISFCEDCISEDLYEAFNWLLWVNSSLNPLLYAATSERFRENFKRLLGFYKITNKSPNPIINSATVTQATALSVQNDK